MGVVGSADRTIGGWGERDEHRRRIVWKHDSYITEWVNPASCHASTKFVRYRISKIISPSDSINGNKSLSQNSFNIFGEFFEVEWDRLAHATNANELASTQNLVPCFHWQPNIIGQHETPSSVIFLFKFINQSAKIKLMSLLPISKQKYLQL